MMPAALQQALRPWDGLLEWLPIGIYACNREGVLIQYNHQASEMWGWSPTPGDPGNCVWDRYRTQGPDGGRLPLTEAPISEALQTGRPVRDREFMVERPDGTSISVLANVDPLFDPDGEVIGAVSCFQDISERKNAEARQDLLIAELNHRVKNTLAIIQAIASQTLQHAGSLGDFRARFQARIMALSHAHDLLTNSNWDGAYLHDIINDVLMPFESRVAPRCTASGAREVRIGPQSAVILAVAFHELATNAAKYGALSNADGRVRIAWSVRETTSTDVRKLHVTWQESGGPPVAAPHHRGFGLKLIETALSKQFENVRLDFAPQGLSYAFDVSTANGAFG